jgi:hypothetical protein
VDVDVSWYAHRAVIERVLAGVERAAAAQARVDARRDPAFGGVHREAAERHELEAVVHERMARLAAAVVAGVRDRQTTRR